MISILRFIEDFDEWKKPTRRLWRAVLAAMFGLEPKDDEAKAEVLALLNRKVWPWRPAPEVWIMAGRRAGKSICAATIALYFAICKTYQLAPGEIPTIMVIAADRKQARVILRYCVGLLRSTKLYDTWITSETQESITLRTGVVIEIHTASFRSTRGYTAVAAVCDEIAFWRNDESSNPDTEILNALRPALATQDGPLVCIGSGYAKRGELYAAYREHYGVDADEILFLKGPSRAFNPTLPQRIVDKAYERDPAAAASEYGGEFRDDVEAFLTREMVDLVVVEKRLELPKVQGVSYRAFLDFAGGSGKDSACLGIAHTEVRDGVNVHVLDLVRERRPPFSPDAVCKEFAGLIRGYGISSARADRWGGQFPVEKMGTYHVTVTPAEKTKSDIYLDFLPIVTSRQCELLDVPRLTMQLTALERRRGRGGHDQVDHPPNGHDDVANGVAGVVVMGIGARGVRVRRL